MNDNSGFLHSTRGKVAAGLLTVTVLGGGLAVVLSNGDGQDGFQGQRALSSGGSQGAANDELRGLGLSTGERGNVNASAAAKASVSANADLKSASKLAGQVNSASQAKARALHARSREQMKLAVAKTKKLAATASSAQDVKVGARTITRVSSALSRDAALQAKIAIAASGNLESDAAKALVADVRMQQEVIKAGMKMAGNATSKTVDVALQSSAKGTQRLVSEVQSSAQVASATSAEVESDSRASAELAVAIGTKTVADSTKLLSTIVNDSAREAQSSSRAAVKATLAALTEASSKIAGTVRDAGIAEKAVEVKGVGQTTLGNLSQLSVDVTSSASVSGEANDDVSVRFGAGGQAALNVLGQ